MIELTCPSEEGIARASTRKQSRYSDLVQNVSRNKWTPVLITVEVGAPGYVATSMLKCLRSLGFTTRQTCKLRKAFSEVSARCSYAIYLSRMNKLWPKRELLVIPVMQSRTQPGPVSVRS